MSVRKKQDQDGPRGVSRRRERAVLLGVVALLAAAAVAGMLIYYNYMDDALFQERNEHFIEIAGKETQVISSAVQHYRTISGAAERLLTRTALRTADALPFQLKAIQRCLDLPRGAVLAFAADGMVYASDGAAAPWPDASSLPGSEAHREVVMTLDYRADSPRCILFLKRLTIPMDLDGTQLTHMAVAVDEAVFQNAFDSDIFQGRSHVYVVDAGGRQLYRHICPGGFLKGENVLDALEDFPFLHGGGLPDLREAVADRRTAGFEFAHTAGGYYVAATPVSGSGWTVLTFVPTEVLGAGTSAFLNTTVAYVAVIGAVVVLMVGLLLFAYFSRRRDLLVIEHQREANNLLRDAADAANAASTAKSDFLSHMSHDIRTPINGIVGMTDIALKNLGDPARVRDCLEKISGASGHLLSLVNDVLDMSRIESGKTRISSKPMDLRQVLDNCASIVCGQLQGRDLALVEEFQPMDHARVLGDELHLRQVLINILGNAVKFTPDGGKIVFRASELPDSGGETARFRLEVEDTGVGMQPEFLPHIFEAFSQEDGGTRSRYQGTGLGMAITKQFVELMGGTIQVESRPGKGSRFTVELPAPIDREARPREVAAQHHGNLRGLRLLVAEDNELNMEIALYLLADEGIETTPVTDGQAAVDAFAAAPPGTFDGVLMDVMMPVLDGLAATRAIRALPRADAAAIPIIAMTANAYDEDKRRCLEAGMNAHVAKPIDLEVLLQVLSHYLRRT